MPLPILNVRSEPGAADLMRFFHRTELHWARHLAEETPLAVGVAMANPELDRVYDANRMLDVALPDGMGPESALAEVEQHFAERGTRCHKWVMNPAAPDRQTVPMVEHLLSRGFQARESEVMYLHRQPAGEIREVGGLKIIPARASYKHARQIAELAAARWGEPQLIEASMLHLDDPHYDALLALKDAQPVARIGVLAVGEIGLIEQVFVTEPHRRQGIGRTMMSRALEICARSLFKHIFLAVAADNTPAIALYEQVGFRRLGPFVEYAHRSAR